ncbi:MAG: hypothetical protein JXB35_08350, partial [Anaerolineae bacterium]|nr:hypothetical protein [Anaerolineae bacterium]
MKRKFWFPSSILIIALVLALLATGCGPTAAPTTEEPTVAATEAPATEPAMDAEPNICGTDEEVTITYIGDPAGSHPAAEAAT